MQRTWHTLAAGLCLGVAAWAAPLAHADEDHELKLKAVFLGRFASYVKWPQQPPPVFQITVVGAHPLGERLAALYADKHIQGKPVRIHTVAQVQDIGTPQLLFVALPTVAARQAAIAYAQSRGILTVSDSKGFAELGGVIQINFVAQNVQIKINHEAAVKTGLHIGAPLLSIATVLRGGSP